MINLANEPKPYAPEWTFNAGVQYAMPIGESASLMPRVNYSYVGSQWTTLFDAPVTEPSTVIVSDHWEALCKAPASANRAP
jgi:hypothetical protein